MHPLLQTGPCKSLYQEPWPAFISKSYLDLLMCPTIRPVTRGQTHMLHTQSLKSKAGLLVLLSWRVLLQLSMSCFLSHDLPSLLWLSVANTICHSSQAAKPLRTHTHHWLFLSSSDQFCWYLSRSEGFRGGFLGFHNKINPCAWLGWI